MRASASNMSRSVTSAMSVNPTMARAASFCVSRLRRPADDGGERSLDIVAAARIREADRRVGIGEGGREFGKAHDHLRRPLIVRAGERDRSLGQQDLAVRLERLQKRRRGDAVRQTVERALEFLPPEAVER